MDGQIRDKAPSAVEKRADADKFWRFFECAMNDLAHKDE
jgi:hypothetical protein